jgi:uncharacterized protein
MPQRTFLPFIVFYAAALAFSWFAWLPLALAGGAVGTPLQFLHFVGGLGPAFGALTAALLLVGKQGAIELWRRASRWQTSAWVYAAAIAGPFAILFAADLIAPVFGGVRLDWSSLFASAEFPGLAPPVYVAAVLVFYGFGEEIGWRGFLAPLFDARWGPVASIGIVSVMWALWHLPLFWFSPGLQQMGIAGAAGWYFSLLAGAALLSWFARQTRGGILLAALFHATMDLAFVTNAGPVTASIVGAAVTILGLGAIGWVSRQRRLRLPGVDPHQVRSPAARR